MWNLLKARPESLKEASPVRKWLYARVALAVTSFVLVAGPNAAYVRAQDSSTLHPQSSLEDEGEKLSPVERFSRWLRSLGEKQDNVAPTGAGESAILNPPKSDKSFDLLNYLEKKREAELSPSPFAAVRLNGSLRVEKKPVADLADSHGALFMERPAWTQLPGHRDRRGAKGRKDSVQPPFDLYLWFLTGLPEKRIRFRLEKYRANHKK